jgi:hypothetical protein
LLLERPSYCARQTIDTTPLTGALITTRSIDEHLMFAVPETDFDGAETYDSPRLKTMNAIKYTRVFRSIFTPPSPRDPRP